MSGRRRWCGSTVSHSSAVRGLPVLALTDSATRVAKDLVRTGVLPEKATVDAFHIGAAAAHQVAYLLTLNCKHLANATMRGTIEPGGLGRLDIHNCDRYFFTGPKGLSGNK